MKKLFFLLTIFALTLNINAQKILLVSDEDVPLVIDDIERITYEEDDMQADSTGENKDVIVLHMKDGTTRRHINGKTKSTYFHRFFYYPFDMNRISTTTHNNGYVAEWNVSGVLKKDGHYLVGVCIDTGLTGNERLPYQFKNKRYGICFGTSPNLTVEKCREQQDSVVCFSETNPEAAYSSNYKRYLYTLIGDNQIVDSEGGFFYLYCHSEDYYNDFGVRVRNLQYNRLPYTLTHGQTYYYRTFVETEVLLSGKMTPVRYYDIEKSFRVPLVMEEAGYCELPRPTDAAYTSFVNKHFPDSKTPPTFSKIIKLWYEWVRTNKSQLTTLLADCAPIEFDNGTTYDLNHIPDKFYTWLTQREVVIDAWDGIAEISKIYDREKNDSIESVKPVLITDVDASWRIPNNRWVSFEPQNAAVNHTVKFRSDEVIPEVYYKLQITFAPETREGYNNLPTNVSILTTPMNGEYIEDNPECIMHFNPIAVPATEVTILESDSLKVSSMGLDVTISTRVTISQQRHDVYSRRMRIAEIRLIPYDVESAQPETSWSNIIVNGDLEGDDVSCFFTKEIISSSSNWTVVPSTVVDGAGVNDSRGIVVTSCENPTYDWDTQFFIRLPRTLPVGAKYRVSFDYRAEQSALVLTQFYGEPCNYIHWNAIGNVHFTEEWKTFEYEGVLPDETHDEMQSIGFLLSHEPTATTYYFDNISFELYKEGKAQITNNLYRLVLPQEDITYDGKSHGASITVSEGIGQATIFYQKKGETEMTTIPPIEVGDYIIYLEISESSHYLGMDCTQVGTFSIYQFSSEEWAIIQDILPQLSEMGWSQPWDVSNGINSVSSLHGLIIEKGSVSGLSLAGQDLTGVFPYAILALPHLKYINMANNRLSGDLGLTAYAFAKQNPTITANLQVLNISNNQLSGNLGMFASCFPRLTYLDASHNCLEDVFPMIPTTVSTLNIRSQTISRVVPLHLANLSKQDIATKVPSILLYDHKNQTFTTNINLLCTTDYDQWGMTMAYQNGQMAVPYVSEQNTYYGESGDTLHVAVLYNNLSFGSKKS